MNITDIKIRKLLSDGRLRAIVSVTIDDTIALHDIKVIEGASRLFVAMPSRRDESGVFRDIVHPISVEGRNSIEDSILNEYQNYIDTHLETRVDANSHANSHSHSHVNTHEVEMYTQ